jgi:hypothetical protein
MVMNTKKCAALFLGLAFVVGVLVVPTLHLAHCSPFHEHHDAGQCPICQIAHTQAVTAAPDIAPDAQIAYSCPFYLPPVQPLPAILIGCAQARGPPSA